MVDMELRRILRVAEAFGGPPPGPPEARFCAGASKLLGAAGVGLSLGASGDLADCGLLTVCATGRARGAEARQLDLGEGPSYTAHRTGRPVLVPDLERDDTWLAFAETARALGFRAVFAFPLRSGARSLGSLTLYRHALGELTSEEYADALVVAGVARGLLTSLQAGHPPDELDQVFTDALSASVEVFQASGVASAQLGVSVGDALALLRAHAFAESCSLSEVAMQVIDRRLRFSGLQE